MLRVANWARPTVFKCKLCLCTAQKNVVCVFLCLKIEWLVQFWAGSLFSYVLETTYNFHKCGVSAGILQPVSMLHVCEKSYFVLRYVIRPRVIRVTCHLGYFSNIGPTEITLNYDTFSSLIESLPHLSLPSLCPATVKSNFLRKSFLLGGRHFHPACEESDFVIMFLNLTGKSLI